MRDLFVAQVWLRAMFAPLYVASGQDERSSGCGVVTPLQVSMTIGSDVQSYVGPEHMMGVPLVQYGQIVLDGGKSMGILDWGEEYNHIGGLVRKACVSLSGSIVLSKAPRELEQVALEFVTQLAGPARQEVMPVMMSFCDNIQRQLTRRVADSDGMLSPDVWRVWLPLFAPDLMVIMLQISAAGGMRPKTYRVPGITPTRVADILMIDPYDSRAG
jgi:hypothetical protein